MCSTFRAGSPVGGGKRAHAFEAVAQILAERVGQRRLFSRCRRAHSPNDLLNAFGLAQVS